MITFIKKTDSFSCLNIKATGISLISHSRLNNTHMIQFFNWVNAEIWTLKEEMIKLWPYGQHKNDGRQMIHV